MPTLALIKPHAVAKGYAPAIEALIEKQSFAVIARAEVTLTTQQAAELYEEYEGTPLFAPMCAAMARGPLVALALEKVDAQAAWLELLGPADPAVAKEEAPLSLRAIYGADVVNNALHGSTSAAAAFREIKYFFPKTCPREVTVAVIKPDAAASADAILAEAAGEGFLTIAKKTVTLSKEQAAQFCAGAADVAASVEHLTSGEVVVAALEKSFGIEGWLALLGPEDAAAAREAAPRSLRARYGSDAVKNGLHGSTSVAAAAQELAFFFGEGASKPELTFAFVKPDAFANADAVLAMAESAGFAILCSEQVTLSEEKAAAFYNEHAGRDFFQPLCDFMTSGPALAMVLIRPCAITAWRSLLGPTDSAKARTAAPLSLRAQFGTDGRRNACHGSDSPASAAREAAFFFPFLEQTQATLGLVLPHAVAAGAVDAVVEAAAAAGLVVTERLVSALDTGRAEDFLDLMGAAAPPKAPPPPPPEPFVSAWLEGGYNKFLQLYNPSDEVVDLAGYALPTLNGKAAKGDGLPAALNLFAAGKCIPPRGVFVAYHPQAAAEMKAQLPVDARHSMPFEGLSNGNDALALVKLAEGVEPAIKEGEPLPFTLLDYVGDFTGAAKGRPWPVAGTPAGTKDKTIVRKPHVSAGNPTVWVDPTASSQGTSAATSEWVVLPKGCVEAPGWSLTEWSAAPPPPPPPPPGSYEAVVTALSAGPVVVLALSGKGAVARWNAVLGPQTPLLAKVRCPGCLRARFGVDASHFAAHGSATAAAAFKELKFFFPKAVVDPLPSSKQAKEYVAETLTPTLTAGLVELCKVKPEAPVEWLANWLIANNPNTPQI